MLLVLTSGSNYYLDNKEGFTLYQICIFVVSIYQLDLVMIAAYTVQILEAPCKIINSMHRDRKSDITTKKKKCLPTFQPLQT